MTTWKQNSDGEWYWPLHPTRPQDHLRVWFIGTPDPDPRDPGRGWHGALVLDGDYSLHIVPQPTAEQAKEAIYRSALEYLRTLVVAFGVEA